MGYQRSFKVRRKVRLTTSVLLLAGAAVTTAARVAMAAKMLAIENCMLEKLVIETRVVVERGVLGISCYFLHPFYNVLYIPLREPYVVGSFGFAWLEDTRQCRPARSDKSCEARIPLGIATSPVAEFSMC